QRSKTAWWHRRSRSGRRYSRGSKRDLRCHRSTLPLLASQSAWASACRNLLVNDKQGIYESTFGCFLLGIFTDCLCWIWSGQAECYPVLSTGHSPGQGVLCPGDSRRSLLGDGWPL